MGEAEELNRQIAREYPRKGRIKESHHMEWVPEIDYRGYKLTLLALEIEQLSEKTGEQERKMFQWLTDLKVTGKNANEFAKAGRGRWKIENEGFNMQKNIRYDIQHVNSENYNGMKCHYLLAQIAECDKKSHNSWSSATLSIWGNPTTICVNGNVQVGRLWDNMGNLTA